MEFSNEILEFIKEKEGFREKPYKDQAGVWTIGYGHTKAAGGLDPESSTKITRKDAEDLLKLDLQVIATYIEKYVCVNLEENKREALYSFVYNIGVNNFKNSNLLVVINNSEFKKVPEEMRRWVHVNGVVNKGLQRRREDEIKFWEGTWKKNKKDEEPRFILNKNRLTKKLKYYSGGFGIVSSGFLEVFSHNQIAGIILSITLSFIVLIFIYEMFR